MYIYLFLFDRRNSKKSGLPGIDNFEGDNQSWRKTYSYFDLEHKYDQDEVRSIFSPLSLAAICNDCHLLLSKMKAIKRNASRMS